MSFGAIELTENFLWAENGTALELDLDCEEKIASATLLFLTYRRYGLTVSESDGGPARNPKRLWNAVSLCSHPLISEWSVNG